MVTYSDPTFTMIRSRIENIEEIQKKVFNCFYECEAQLRQIAEQFADTDSVSENSNLFQPPKARVLAKHHGWQWLLGHANMNNKTEGSSGWAKVNFDDIIVEKDVQINEIIDINCYKTRPLVIGMKVLAEYNTTEAPGVYYAASIAEIPDKQNNFRYLLLFDDGTAGYVVGDQCFICPDQSFISSVNPIHKQFVQYYNKMYREGGFQILDLSLQNNVVVEVNGEWNVCPINYTDCNIANVQVSPDHAEFVYCGSYRFGPIYQRLKEHLVL